MHCPNGQEARPGIYHYQKVMLLQIDKSSKSVNPQDTSEDTSKDTMRTRCSDKPEASFTELISDRSCLLVLFRFLDHTDYSQKQ
ncbi:hypothetical protein CDES_10515 [Corynebacterium deserti GIMN1.010]|uniref:Uncharacterized protein n=1 Tax=Corynebacterium deserti GIMN1.010 TaxID=931089 RepID=A0A0M4CEU8_9CORY|nr:hypothetical protein CDES_10515 [Corynebacterium deserti GIMN1.010]